jgi:hypothetical protein
LVLALDQALVQASLPPQVAFEAFHLATIALVIVAKQM